MDLEGFKPPIWRRIIVPATFTFADLHRTLQIAFGWEDRHLHLFEMGSERIGDPEQPHFGDVVDETELRLVDALWLLSDGSEGFRYVYDFGDDWRHALQIEERIEDPPDRAMPRCLTGRRAAPQEDSRGLEEERMFQGDPGAFDAETVDARLERLRIWWAAEGEDERRGRLPMFPSSDELVWVGEAPDGCLACSGELAAADVALEVAAKDGLGSEIRLEAWVCTACGMIHAWASDLRGRLGEQRMEAFAIDRVSIEGKTLDIHEDSVELPEAPGSPASGQDQSAGSPLEALGRLSVAGRSFEASGAWEPGMIEDLVAVQVGSEGVFYVARLSMEASGPGLFVTRDLEQAEALEATINPHPAQGSRPRSPSGFDEPVIAVGPCAMHLLERSTADRLIEAGLARDQYDEVWLPLRLDAPSPALADGDPAVFHRILVGLEVGLREARDRGRAVVDADGVEIQIRVLPEEEGDPG